MTQEINVKIVSRFVVDAEVESSVISTRLRQLATTGVKQYGFDRSELRIRSLSNNRVELSLNARLSPTPIKRRTP